MSAATLAPGTAAPSAITGRAGLGRLTAVEMRKTIDTRSGKWLLALIALASVAVVVLLVAFGRNEAEVTIETFLSLSMLPAALLLPVLGILGVTSEWSQRTALTTFALTPDRRRIVAAKLLAGVVFALAATAVGIAAAYIGHGLSVATGDVPADWTLSAAAVGKAALFSVLNLVMGVGFGMLFLSSPLAIVSFFLLPTLWQVLTQTVPAVEDAAVWLDVNTAMEPLIDPTMSMTGDSWQHLGTSALVWIALPLLLGALRVVRSEIK